MSSARVGVFFITAWVAVTYSIPINSEVRLGIQRDFNDLAPTYKTWWSKEITRDLQNAGRLTETQIKYAAEAGFKSIISNFVFATPGWIGEEYLPTTDEARDLATDLGGLYYGVVLQPGEAWAEVEAVRRFTELMAEAPRPVLYNCGSSMVATFVAIAYLANQTVFDPGFLPQVNSEEFYRRAAATGHYFNNTEQKQVISDITGEPVVSNPPQLDISQSNWPGLNWLIKPVLKNIYIAGQVRNSYADMVDSAADAVVNFRKRVIEPPNIPSQEEVTLLNILDNTGTYVDSGRQSEERLLQTRIDPTKPNEWIDSDSPQNYASLNTLEFGDGVGYNEDVERAFWEGRGTEYHETSIAINGTGEYDYTVDMWNAYRDTWRLAARAGNDVLFKCRIGKRAIIAALLTIGDEYGYNSDWALTRANELGYHLEEAGEDAAVQLLRDVLG